MFTVFIQGFLLQASLILALGAQNIFVLNSGLRKQNHMAVALVSSICDALLIFVGVLGVATFFIQFPFLKICLGILGVGFLFYYGILKLIEAKKGIQFFSSAQTAIGLRQTILMSLGFSLLNPHVYLDTIVLIGGYSSQFTSVGERFNFGAGAAAFSVIWFFGLSLLASWASRFLNNPQTMRVVSFVSGLILVLLAIKLSGDVFEWVKAVLP